MIRKIREARALSRIYAGLSMWYKVDSFLFLQFHYLTVEFCYSSAILFNINPNVVFCFKVLGLTEPLSFIILIWDCPPYMHISLGA